MAITSVDFRDWGEADPKILNHYLAYGERLPGDFATALDALERPLN